MAEKTPADWIEADEVVEMVGVAKQTMYGYVAAGYFQSYPHPDPREPGTKRVYSRSEVQAYLDSRVRKGKRKMKNTRWADKKTVEDYSNRHISRMRSEGRLDEVPSAPEVAPEPTPAPPARKVKAPKPAPAPVVRASEPARSPEPAPSPARAKRYWTGWDEYQKSRN